MRFALVLVVAGLLTFGATAMAAICPKCEGMAVTADIGQCAECGGTTASGAYKLCSKCSAKLGQCERCRKDLSEPASPKRTFDFADDGSAKVGRWEYRWTISNKGTRSAGVYGTLLYDGAIVPDPKNVNDFYETPFGSIYFIGRPAVQFGAHGWMPTPVGREASGTSQPHPAGIEKTIVYVEVITDGTFASEDSAVSDQWVKDELTKLGVRDARVQRKWFALTNEPATIHDTKLYGRALLSFAPSKGNSPLTMAVTGSQKSTIEIPRQNGATRLVKHTMQDHLGNTLDLYLAVRTEISLGASGAATQPTKDPWSILD